MKVAVLGGGISGLSVAWGLLRASPAVFQVVLIEASNRWGGWIRSERTKQGAVFETGPRSMRTAQRAGKTGLWLVDQLGLGSSVIPVVKSHSRLIFTNQHGLLELPSGPSWLLRAKEPFTHPLLPSLVKELFARRREMEEEEETVHHFACRRLGKEVAEWLMDPLCRGIYAGSSHDLSVRSCFPVFHQYEQSHGSLIMGAFLTRQEPSGFEGSELVKRAAKEKWLMYSLEGGLQTLVETLVEAVEEMGGELLLNSGVTSVEFDGGRPKVHTEGKCLEVDHIVSTLPSHALSKLLPKECAPLSSSLSSIPSVNVATVNLLYDRNVLPQQFHKAFGYLVPSHQTSNILGTVFDSSVFPELTGTGSSTSLTVMMGGQWFSKLFGEPGSVQPSLLQDMALSELQEHLCITAPPTEAHTSVHVQCIPQYRTGHSSILREIQLFIDRHQLPLSLLGASFTGVSVNDCISNSLNESKRLLDNLQTTSNTVY